jgi:hypothetical protein
MKKLNITKKQYEESKYFNKKYGTLKFVSESGKLFKTDKGVVLALEGTETQGDAQGAEGDGQQTDESLKDIGDAIKGTAKELGNKVKDGVKKAKKAIGDAIKGPFRKGDQVEMSNDQGDTCTATITSGTLGGKEYTVMLQRKMAAEAEGDEGADAEVTRGELTDILKDVVAEVEKVCDSQDISFEEVAGVEKPEGESDEEADKDEVVATKEDVADALQGVIDAVEKVADANEIELPQDDETTDDDGEQVDEGCDCGKKDCPECGGQACECGNKEPVMESRKARAKLVREAIARRARARKLRESRVRRAKVRKVMESIRRRRAAKKVLESIRKRRAAKKVMESRRIRARKAGMAK